MSFLHKLTETFYPKKVNNLIQKLTRSHEISLIYNDFDQVQLSRFQDQFYNLVRQRYHKIAPELHASFRAKYMETLEKMKTDENVNEKKIKNIMEEMQSIDGKGIQDNGTRKVYYARKKNAAQVAYEVHLECILQQYNLPCNEVVFRNLFREFDIKEEHLILQSIMEGIKFSLGSSEDTQQDLRFLRFFNRRKEIFVSSVLSLSKKDITLLLKEFQSNKDQIIRQYSLSSYKWKHSLFSTSHIQQIREQFELYISNLITSNLYKYIDLELHKSFKKKKRYHDFYTIGVVHGLHQLTQTSFLQDQFQVFIHEYIEDKLRNDELHQLQEQLTQRHNSGKSNTRRLIRAHDTAYVVPIQQPVLPQTLINLLDSIDKALPNSDYKRIFTSAFNKGKQFTIEQLQEYFLDDVALPQIKERIEIFAKHDMVKFHQSTEEDEIDEPVLERNGQAHDDDMTSRKGYELTDNTLQRLQHIYSKKTQANRVDLEEVMGWLEEAGYIFLDKSNFLYQYDITTHTIPKSKIISQVVRHLLYPELIPLHQYSKHSEIDGTLRKLRLNKGHRLLFWDKYIVMIGNHQLYDSYLNNIRMGKLKIY